MRILLLNKYLWRRDGVTTVLEETARLLRQEGCRVRLFGQEGPQSFAPDLVAGTVPEVSLAEERGAVRAQLCAILRILFSWGAKRTFCAVLARQRPHVCHMHNIYHHLGPHLIAACRRRRIPVVMTLHDYKLFCPCYLFLRPCPKGRTPCTLCVRTGPLNALRFRCVRKSALASLLCCVEALLHKHLYCQVDCFIAPSSWMARWAHRAGIAQRRIVTIPNPAPLTERIAQGTPPRKRHILFLGRLYPEKGAHLLVEAAARLKTARAQITIAGDGPQQAELAEKARALGAPVSFAGFVRGAEKRRLLEGALCVVMPSLWFENCPMTALEAFAAGVPVVASRIGALPELVQHEVNGLLVPPGDSAALSGALLQLLRDPTLRERLARKARCLASERFHPKRYVSDLLGLYRRLAPSG